MAGENTVTTLNGNFKETYADQLEFATPKGLHFQTDIAFVERDQMPGNKYHQPVLLAHEAGFTYAAAGATAPIALNAAVAGTTKDATIVGGQIFLRSRLDYEAAARASSGGKRAFRQAVDIVVENMWDSFKKRVEIDELYGQASIGEVSSITAGVITIKTASWAPGIWAGMEGAILEAFDGIGATATQHNADLTITAVDIIARTVTVSGTSSSVVANDFLFFKTQRTATAHNSVLGIHGVMNIGSGTDLFGINPQSYSLWKPSTYSMNSGPLNFPAMNKAVAVGVGKGLVEDVNLYISPAAWANLLNDEAALRRWTDFSGGNKAAGAEGLKFFSQNGSIMIRPSIYVKEGFAYMISPKLWKRVGATDITFRLPDRGDEFFLHVPDFAAYELRAYSNQAPFTKAPAKAILLTNIVNT